LKNLGREEIVDHHHVRLLTQRAAGGGQFLVGAAADFTLADECAVMFVDESNLPFERDDVARTLPIDQIHQRGDERRPTVAARAGDEHKAFCLARQRLNFRTETELLG